MLCRHPRQAFHAAAVADPFNSSGCVRLGEGVVIWFRKDLAEVPFCNSEAPLERRHCLKDLVKLLGLNRAALEGVGVRTHTTLTLAMSCSVAKWIHFTLSGIILPTAKLKVYTSWGL